MISFLITAIKFIFLLGFLVFIHEGGHFVVAKLCKVRVHDFAIGFGPIIFKKQIGDTLYSIRLIPLGGYVRMEGEEEASSNEGSFSQKSIPQRIAIVLAGASVNIIFGLAVYFILISASPTFVSNKIDKLEPGYGAEVAGIMPGDEIIKINNKNIHLKSDLEKEINKTGDKEANITIKRGNSIINYKVTPNKVDMKNTGLYFGAQNDELTSEVKAIYPDSPAQNAGIKEKDIIIKVNGEEVENNPYKVIELTQNSTEETIVYTVNRKGTEINIEVKPNIVSQYYLGVTLQNADKTFINSIKYGFWSTVDFSVSIIDNLKLLFSGKVSTNQLMGPIGISTMVADTNGFVEFIYLLALISLSLGVTNLIPIPPLDGWKVVVYLIEAIRRKPMNEKVQMQIEALGFAFIIVLSIYVAYNDILRI